MNNVLNELWALTVIFFKLLLNNISPKLAQNDPLWVLIRWLVQDVEKINILLISLYKLFKTSHKFRFSKHVSRPKDR